MGGSRFHIEVVFEYHGYADLFPGHDHALVDENVVACISFGFGITYLETVQDIIDMVLEYIASREYPISFLNEAAENEELQREIEEFLTGENVARAIMEKCARAGLKPSDRFFEIYPPEEEEKIRRELEEGRNPFGGEQILFGYIHVWKLGGPSSQ